MVYSSDTASCLDGSKTSNRAGFATRSGISAWDVINGDWPHEPLMKTNSLMITREQCADLEGLSSRFRPETCLCVVDFLRLKKKKKSNEWK